MNALALPPQKLHWALAVLALLRERPMHPYEMRRLIRERHKDQRLLIKAGSLYHAIAWLEKERFIQAIETVRVGNRPERTVYKILKTGEQALLASLKQLLAEPARETSSLAVALDHAVHLQPLDVAENLQRRAELLQPRIQQMEHILKNLVPAVGRINLLEVDFECAQSRAELAWLQKLTKEIRSGSFSWHTQQILGYLRQAHSHQQNQTNAQPAAELEPRAEPLNFIHTMQTNKLKHRSTETPNYRNTELPNHHSPAEPKHRNTELPKHRPFHSLALAAISVALLFPHAGLAAPSTNDTAKASSSKLLPVADFEKGRLITISETAWTPFTDEVLAGKSSINPSITNSGAAGSKAAMQLTGKLTADFQWGGFAGVAARFLKDGGSTNLSKFTGIQFHARGDGKPCRVVIGKENIKDNNHFFAEFRAKPEWTLIKVSFAELAQSPFFGTQVTWSPDNINSIAFMAIAQPEETREFKLELDNISFY